MVPKQDKTDVDIVGKTVLVTKVFLVVNKKTCRYSMFPAPSNKTQITLLPAKFCCADAIRDCSVHVHMQERCCL